MPIQRLDCEGLWAIDVHDNTFVSRVFRCKGIPDWVNHDTVSIYWQRHLVIDEREGESFAKVCRDKLSSGLRHQQDIEMRRLERALRTLNPVVLQAFALLDHRYRETEIIETDLVRNLEYEKGLLRIR